MTDTNRPDEGQANTDRDRVVLVQSLEPDRVEEYVAAHDDVPDPVVDVMAENGIERYELFVYDTLAISYVVATDFEAFTEAYGADPEVEAWEKHVESFKRSGVDPETGEMPAAERIWTFTTE
jgi:L-rhamnose mutarotase